MQKRKNKDQIEDVDIMKAGVTISMPAALAGIIYIAYTRGFRRGVATAARKVVK